MDILEKLSSVKIVLTLDNVIVVLLILTFIILMLVLFIKLISKKLKDKIKIKTITVNGIAIDIECNNSVKKLADEVWIELATRKIALPFDEENDVIVEIYDSWYKTFSQFREILKRVPIKDSDNVEKLSKIILAALNDILRSHLTKWQARFRKWYDKHKDDDGDPQDIQKKYPQYKELVNDLKSVNNEMVKLTNQLDKIRKGE